MAERRMKVNPNLAEIVESLYQKGYKFHIDMTPYNKEEEIERIESEGCLLLGLSERNFMHYVYYR